MKYSFNKKGFCYAIYSISQNGILEDLKDFTKTKKEAIYLAEKVWNNLAKNDKKNNIIEIRQYHKKDLVIENEEEFFYNYNIVKTYKIL